MMRKKFMNKILNTFLALFISIFYFSQLGNLKAEPIFLLCDMKGLYSKDGVDKKLENVQIILKLIIGREDVEKIYPNSFNTDAMVLFDPIYTSQVWIIKDHKAKSEVMDIDDYLMLTDHTIRGGQTRNDKKPIESFSQINFEIDRYSGIFSFLTISATRYKGVSLQQTLKMNGKCDQQQSQIRKF